MNLMRTFRTANRIFKPRVFILVTSLVTASTVYNLVMLNSIQSDFTSSAALVVTIQIFSISLFVNWFISIIESKAFIDAEHTGRGLLQNIGGYNKSLANSDLLLAIGAIMFISRIPSFVLVILAYFIYICATSIIAGTVVIAHLIIISIPMYIYLTKRNRLITKLRTSRNNLIDVNYFEVNNHEEHILQYIEFRRKFWHNDLVFGSIFITSILGAIYILYIVTVDQSDALAIMISVLGLLGAVRTTIFSGSNFHQDLKSLSKYSEFIEEKICK
jgi:hypothetical protein